jgi:hypothetical protein
MILAEAPMTPSECGDWCCFSALYRTIDGGQSWTRVSIDNADRDFILLDMDIDPHDSNNVYVLAQFACVPSDVGPGCESNPSDGIYKSVRRDL